MGGDAIINDALRYWTRYLAVVKPLVVTRVALRYINRLDLPLRTGEEFSAYLQSPPDLPDGAPQSVSSFLSRIVAIDDSGAQTIVTQKLDASGGETTPLIIDLDVFFAREIAPEADNIRPYLDTLRRIKNRTFFALLTEKTAKLYE
jgi:uncharacterized protein (TIGR04255 family)